MKNIPIGLKLGLGFGIVLILLTISGGTAYHYISSNLDLFKDYRSLARQAILMNEAQADMLKVRMRVKEFLTTGSEDDFQKYEKLFKTARSYVVQAQEGLSIPAASELVLKAEKIIDAYDEAMNQVENIQKQTVPHVEQLTSTGPMMENMLVELMESADEDGDARAAYHAGKALGHLLSTRMYATKFLDSTSPDFSDKAFAELDAFSKVARQVEQEIFDPGRKAAMKKIELQAANYRSELTAVVDLLLKRTEIVAGTLYTSGPEIARNLDEAQNLLQAEQKKLGPMVQGQSEFAVKIVGLLTIAALVVGLFAAVFITLGITRPLARLTRFAELVSFGKFDEELNVHRRDEIGKLADAVRAVPETLDRFHGELDRVISKVSVGHVRERGNAETFHGSYASLIEDVNAMADSLTEFLDSVPTPIMTMDTDFNILFMNKFGAETGRERPKDVEGTKCRDFFKTGDCGTDKCACAKALNTNSEASSSTDAHPGNNDLEISYTGVPIRNREGEVVGALEVVLDQTDIVRAQKQMADVAHRAEEISQRLAAAAEELSAQVHQVSRGSEIQRDRVNETATAMEQMNATVLEVARSASSASADTGTARDRATEGSQVVKQAVSSISEVHKAAMDLQENMQQLGVQADSIGQVMNVISDIADQTNLLALNAAIEAARAGDAGRGFAVVADEVRKLAEKTMGATQEVGQSINAIQQVAKINITGMNQAAETVTEATDLANKSGDALTAIVDLVSNSAAQVEGIAAASEEQSAASEQITNSIDEINRIVAETAEGTTQSSIAVKEVASMSSELTVLIGELQNH